MTAREALIAREALPPITLTPEDCGRLSRLADDGLASFPQAAEFLAREVDRAHIAPLNHSLTGLVRMGSRIEFRDDVTGQVRLVTLVYPEQADISAGKISVLTPVGAALIGLSVGQSIEWRTPGGGLRSLTVLSVPERDEPSFWQDR
jgi:regulator of nucleoside diphosphate kinase